MLFFDDRGECGGLTFSSETQKGKYGASRGLLFDRYGQDQTVGLVHNDNNGRYFSGLRVWDRSTRPRAELAARVTEIEKMPDGEAKNRAFDKISEDFPSATRLMLGRGTAEDSFVALYDKQGVR